MPKRLTKEEFQRRGEEIHQDENGKPLYGYDEVVYIDAKTKVKLWCKKCQKYFWQTPDGHLQGRGCPDCANKIKADKQRKTLEHFIEEVEEVHQDENGNPLYGYDEVVYINCETKVKLYCYQCQKYFWQIPSAHLRGEGCPYCVGKHKTTEHFIEEAEEVHQDENGNPLYGYDEVVYINAYTKVKLWCKKCQKYFWQTPDNHLHGRGCPECAGKIRADKQRKTLEQFKSESIIIHGNKYGFDEAVYINSSTKIKLWCKECQKYFWQTPANHLQGKGCPYCNESQGERKIRVWLEQKSFKKDEDYIPQYRDKWLESLTLDFYLPELKIGIEYDGRQHFEPIDAFGGEEQFIKVQERDSRKNLLCEENGIKLIRIPYTDFDNVENILEETWQNITFQ